MNKTKKMNKIEKKYADFGQAGKIKVQLMINIMKMEKMLKSEKFLIIFPKIWTEQ